MAVRDDTGDLVVDSAGAGNWHPRLPGPPSDFPTTATFALRREESEFFRDQLRIRARGSLLQFLVETRQDVTQIDAPWNVLNRSDMPKDLISMLDDGQHYSELMHGAQLLYNLMLAEKRKHKDWVGRYMDSLAGWEATVSPRMALYSAWDRQHFWSLLQRANGHLPAAAKLFSERWIVLVLECQASHIAQSASARQLIAEREQRMKGTRARLVNPDQLNLWGGASGTGQLDYRWDITQKVVNDIVRGFPD
jgi:hypothetical protein